MLLKLFCPFFLCSILSVNAELLSHDRPFILTAPNGFHLKLSLHGPSIFLPSLPPPLPGFIVPPSEPNPEQPEIIAPPAEPSPEEPAEESEPDEDSDVAEVPEKPGDDVGSPSPPEQSSPLVHKVVIKTDNGVRVKMLLSIPPGRTPPIIEETNPIIDGSQPEEPVQKPEEPASEVEDVPSEAEDEIEELPSQDVSEPQPPQGSQPFILRTINGVKVKVHLDIPSEYKPLVEMHKVLTLHSSGNSYDLLRPIPPRPVIPVIPQEPQPPEEEAAEEEEAADDSPTDVADDSEDVDAPAPPRPVSIPPIVLTTPNGIKIALHIALPPELASLISIGPSPINPPIPDTIVPPQPEEEASETEPEEASETEPEEEASETEPEEEASETQPSESAEPEENEADNSESEAAESEAEEAAESDIDEASEENPENPITEVQPPTPVQPTIGRQPLSINAGGVHLHLRLKAPPEIEKLVNEMSEITYN